MAPPFVHRLRVRYAECDAQGIVFNANYVMYFDTAVTELWREAFGHYLYLLDRGLDLAVGEVRVRYRSPARFDDELDIGITVVALGTTSMTMALTVVRVADGALLAEGDLRHVFIDAKAYAKTPIPDDMRATLARYAAPDAA